MFKNAQWASWAHRFLDAFPRLEAQGTAARLADGATQMTPHALDLFCAWLTREGLADRAQIEKLRRRAARVYEGSPRTVEV